MTEEAQPLALGTFGEWLSLEGRELRWLGDVTRRLARAEELHPGQHAQAYEEWRSADEEFQAFLYEGWRQGRSGVFWEFAREVRMDGCRWKSATLSTCCASSCRRGTRPRLMRSAVPCMLGQAGPGARRVPSGKLAPGLGDEALRLRRLPRGAVPRLELKSHPHLRGESPTPGLWSSPGFVRSTPVWGKQST